MKNQRKRTWTALLLAVSILFTLPVWVTGSVRAVDLEGPCSLTMVPSDNSAEETADITENAHVVVDLYRVANAVEVPGYDTYDYQLIAPFTELEGDLAQAREAEPEEGSVTWEQLAGRAANIALGENNSGLQKTTANMGEAAELTSGLYLVVAHSEGMALTDYVKNEENGIVTIAQSPEYEYTFATSLVSLPSTNANLATTGMNTADGTWANNVTGTLKFSREQRFGDLTITKTLDGYSPAHGASFVFQVEARGANDEIVYSNVVSMEFTASGTQSYTLERIPAQSEVTVTEVYSGTAYAPAAATPPPVVIIAADTVEVAFENSYTGGGNYSSSTLNHFEYTADGWAWTQQ